MVYERASALEALGAGIQLAPNGMKVLRALGLEGEILSRGFLPEALEMRLGQSGRRIFSIPVRHVAPYRWRAPYVHIHGADLIAVLAGALKAAAPDALRLGTPVQSIDNARGAVRLDDGREELGDVVIAADGFRSDVRAQVFDAPPPRDTGMIAWRAVVPAQRLAQDTPPDTLACGLDRADTLSPIICPRPASLTSLASSNDSSTSPSNMSAGTPQARALKRSPTSKAGIRR